MVPNGPRPIPIPSVSKSLLPWIKKMCLNIFYDFYGNQKIPLPGGLKRRLQVKVTKIIAAVFPSGSKKKKSNNDDKHGHGLEKRRPPTLSKDTFGIYVT